MDDKESVIDIAERYYTYVESLSHKMYVDALYMDINMVKKIIKV